MTPDDDSGFDPIIALYKHWCIARSVGDTISDGGVEAEESVGINIMLAEIALLYVVIEGYTAIGRIFPILDATLADSEKVDCLRRFRNSIFHYQSDPYTEKMVNFFADDANLEWLARVKSAFSLYFRMQLPNYVSLR